MATAQDDGETMARLDEREGLSVRQAHRAIAEARTRPPTVALDELSPSETLAEVVAVHREVVRELGRLGRLASPSSARVGALKSRAQVAASLVDLLARAGLVPQAVEWAVLRDVESLATAITRMAAELGVDLAEIEAAAAEERRLPPLRISVADTPTPEPVAA